jgi:hypothetical protein
MPESTEPVGVAPVVIGSGAAASFAAVSFAAASFEAASLRWPSSGPGVPESVIVYLVESIGRFIARRDDLRSPAARGRDREQKRDTEHQ